MRAQQPSAQKTVSYNPSATIDEIPLVFRNMQGSTWNRATLSDFPVNSQRLYTRRTILSENINRRRLSREYEKRSKAQPLSNGNYDDDEDDAEFFENIKKTIFKEDAPPHRDVYASKGRTSRLDENFWNVMRDFKQNLKQQQQQQQQQEQERRTIPPAQEAFRIIERKSDYPSNLFESGNEGAFSRSQRRALYSEINSILRNIAQHGNDSQRTSTTQPAAFSFSDDVTESPVVLSSADELFEKQIEEKVYYISANRLIEFYVKANVQSRTT